MSEFENGIREAFLQIHAPDELQKATLAFIEHQRVDASDDHPQVDVRAESHPLSQPHFFRMRIPKRAFAIAACLVLTVLALGGYRVYATPTAYIDVDVNPSIELSVNRFDRVVDVEALNDDGALLLESVGLEHLKAENALSRLVASDAFTEYASSGSFLSISVVSDDEAQALKLEGAGASALKSCRCDGVCFRVDDRTWREARNAGMGVGRYQAARELMELDPTITLEECSDMTMRELRDRIEDLGGSVAIGDGYHGNGESDGSGDFADGRGNGHGNRYGAHDSDSR